MKNIDKRDWIAFFCVIAAAVAGEILFFYKQGTPMVDIGREFYIAERVSQGAVLYKDLFNIYGPLSYQINGILFKLFGLHTDVLYLFGNFVGLCIVGSLYVLSRQFVSRFYAVIAALFAVFSGIFKTGVFNLVVPYSFGLTYGFLAIIISLFLLVKYLNKPEKNIFLYVSAIFAGAAVSLKYDYFAYVFVYLYVIYILKKYDWKILVKLCASFFLLPVLSLGTLFLQGLNIDDIIRNAVLMKNIAKAPSLYIFYKEMDVFLSAGTFLKCMIVLLFYGVLFFLGVKLLRKIEYSKFYGAIVFMLAFICFLWGLRVDYLQYYPPLAVFLVIFCLKENKNIERNYILLIMASLLLSLKTVFCINTRFYGMIPNCLLVLASIAVIVKYLIKNDRIAKSIFVIFFAGIVISCIRYGLVKIPYYVNNIVTPKGKFLAGKPNSPESFLVKLLREKTRENDSIVILPEGHIVNFLINRKSDDMYNNFIPMYVEAFGEQNIINHYAKNKPDYFVLSTFRTYSYGKEFICKDYALDLCDWIFNNYTLLYKISGMPEYYILRKN